MPEPTDAPAPMPTPSAFPDPQQFQANQQPAMQTTTPPTNLKAPVKGHPLMILGIILFLVLISAVSFLLYNNYGSPILKTSSQIVQKVSLLAPGSALMGDVSKLSSTQSIAVNYSVSSPLLTGTLGSILGGGNLSIAIFRLDKNIKVLVDMGSAGAIAIYRLNNLTVTCSQITILQFSSSGGSLQCSSNSTTIPSNLTSFNAHEMSAVFGKLMNSSLKYTGTSTIMGRSCDNFSVTLNSTQLRSIEALAMNSTSNSSLSNLGGSMLASSIPSGMVVRIGACLDKQYGVPELLNVSYSNYSKLTNSNKTTTLFVLRATSISTNVNPSTFTLPVSYSIDSFACTNSSVSLDFTSFTNSTNRTIMINNFRSAPLFGYGSNQQTNPNAPGGRTLTMDLGQGSMAFGKSYKLSTNVDSHLSDSASYSGDVCINGKCQNESCYTPYVYQPYNYTNYNYTQNYTSTIGGAS